MTLSRSRPFHKNDNPRVEQKNATLVRAYLGGDRIDLVALYRTVQYGAQTLALNRLYDKMRVYYHLFQPVMHLLEKEVIQQAGKPTRIKRRYDEACTPFDRLCKTEAILPPHREQLAALWEATNPRRLRQEIYDDIEHLFTLPGAASDHPENVHLTLAHNRQKGDDELFNFTFDRTQIKTSSSATSG